MANSSVASYNSAGNIAPYFVPEPSQWPVRVAVSLLFMTAGAATWVNSGQAGPFLLACGLLSLVLVLFGWFGNVIREGQNSLHNAQVDRSFRLGMAWFIFTEVMFFGAMFAAVFYMREISVPDLAHGLSAQLWQGYSGGWPASGPGLHSTVQPMSARGVPALNTALLLLSGLTITMAHQAMPRGNFRLLIFGLAATVALGLVFLLMQATEYRHAISELHLTLSQGAYGATFFLLTGFHGVHVAVGVTMVSVILVRSLLGQLTPQHHFALDAISWYWHFVGVVWLLLYIVVYCL